ncbi:RNA 2'-phosphotransferase [Aureibacter tunicatorum]|uniref:Probable RNA 2'-phosphotransferase n=1 Tax=Aureibacter tunicatorum TaxID=866807 RepID=A0AAE3XSW8_9BACT|nr:RNA 2'-phosphotransferase [Aureibacter tunicatorum]MDR6241009.1 putative RNA 2'-phosphotransferase [Aureibacter tunicatorum]BDD03787.1 putative RNA 2'-phosphotransferase [Aureibacter tunicatorum]
MEGKDQKKISKFLSLVLRHQPQIIGIKLDAQGWANVEELIHKINAKGRSLDFVTLEQVVETNDKKRFGFNNDKTKIRANQGHSIDINLGYVSKTPPEVLYHGTGSKYVNSIYKSGIQKQSRHHVHLSKDLKTAISVGQRHGKPVVLEILTEKMMHEGFEFFESENGVWLTDEVPVGYFKKLEEGVR